MQNLDEKEWHEFDFAEIFDIKKGFYNKKPEGSGNGTIPFLGATDSNNGVTRFLTLDEIMNSTKTGVLPNSPLDKKLFPGHAIAVTNNGSVGHAYYQATPFTCSHDINPLYLRDHEMSRDEADFLIKAIEEQGKLFQYARKWRPIRMVKSKIMLPVTDSGEPDYEYMAEYTQQKRGAMLAKYRAYVEERIAELGEYVEISALDEKEWCEFRIGELFKVSRPAARNKNDYQAGDIPFVASGSVNNGVMKFCEPFESERLDDGCCITVSPVDGSTFFQPMNFLGRGGAGSSILMLRCSGLNLYRGQFIARAIQQTCSKYTYGHMGNKDNIKRERIMLPVTESGEPDYEYMEQYAKNLMLKKYKQYLTFLDYKKDSGDK